MTQAADLAGLIAALGLPRPAVLGHSMGAATALVLAGNHPDVPGAILLEDPGPWWTGWPATAEEKAYLTSTRALYEQVATLSRAAIIEDRRRRRPDWMEAEREAWADAKLRTSPHAFQAFDPEIGASVDWSAVLGQITCRALLIHTDLATGGVVSPQAAETLQRRLPQLQIAYIPGVSHSIRRANFTRFMEVVEAFLAG